MKIEMSEMEVLMVGTLLRVHVNYPERVALAERLLDQLGPCRPSGASYTPPGVAGSPAGNNVKNSR